MPAGRRSGKTELVKRRLVKALAEKKDWPDPRYFAAAPTRDQAKRIFWADLKRLVPGEWIKKISETELRITTKAGSEIWVVGLDKPERIEGTPWDGGVLDEYGNMKPSTWPEHVRPALSDRHGWCWFIGVPEGLNHYKELADYAKSGDDDEWGFYTWPSADIIPHPEIEGARRTLDPRTFRQEYEASFEGATGRVYYAYSRQTHETASAEVVPELPLIVCCDFNVDPCVWEAAQTDGVNVRVVDEIARRNTNTVEMGKELLRRYGKHRAGLIIYGDAAGSARSTAGESDYAILGSLGLKYQRVKRQNPRVKDRVNAVNGMLANALGETRLVHHPRCVELRKDFETVQWDATGTEIDKSCRERTHATDALGYFIEHEFALRLSKADPSKRFYK